MNIQKLHTGPSATLFLPGQSSMAIETVKGSEEKE